MVNATAQADRETLASESSRPCQSALMLAELIGFWAAGLETGAVAGAKGAAAADSTAGAATAAAGSGAAALVAGLAEVFADGLAGDTAAAAGAELVPAACAGDSSVAGAVVRAPGAIDGASTRAHSSSSCSLGLVEPKVSFSARFAASAEWVSWFSPKRFD